MFHEPSGSAMASTPASILLTSASSAPLEVQDVSISSTAEKARRLLLCCQELQDEEPKRMAGVQLSRFNLWTSNIGVFSSQHASLDYRLRTAPMVKIAIEGNLEILCQHLLLALKACTELLDEDSDAFSDLSGVELSHYGSKLLQDSPPDTDARVTAFDTIDSTISTLHRLSLAIRKASNRNALAKIPKLLDVDIGYTVVRQVQTDLSLLKSSVDPIQFEVATGFEEFLRRVLKSRWFRSNPEITLNLHQEEYRELLLRRCITSISSRRRQLSYFQSHQARLAMPRQIKKTTLLQKPAKSTDNATSPSNAERLTVQRPSIHKFLDTPRSETAATDLDMPAFRASPSTAAPSSAASASEVGGLRTGGTFEVPPAPKLDKGEKEKMCPYCCLVFPDQLFSTDKKSRKWKKHLLEDMQPYVCIFKNCDQAGKSYRSFKEWQAHLKKPHDQDWVCPLSHQLTDTNEEQTFIFDTVEHFQSHLNAAHPDLEDSSTHSIFRVASQLAALPQWCFVCLDEQTSDVALQRHVANHLESAFLLALPGRDDIEESNEASMGKPSTGTTGSGTAQPFETDLPDLRDLYSDSDEISAKATKNISSNDFATQLSTLNAMSTSLEERVGMLDGRSSDSNDPSFQHRIPVLKHRRSHDRTDLMEAPRLSQSWRALITVAVFLVHIRKRARISKEIHDFESLEKITWDDVYREAFLCVKKSRWEEAEGWAWYIADAFEKYEGKQHPCTLMSLANLASVFAFRRKWVQAENLEQRVLQMRIIVLGGEHPDTLTAMHNLASTYANRGKWEEAAVLFEDLVVIQKRVLGKNHLVTKTSIFSLAMSYFSQGESATAMSLLDSLFDTLDRSAGLDHWRLLNMVESLRQRIPRGSLPQDPNIQTLQTSPANTKLLPPPPPSQQPPPHPPPSSSETNDESAYVNVPLNSAPVSEYPFARRHSIMRESNWHADSVDQDDARQEDDVKKEDDVEKVDDAAHKDDVKKEDDAEKLDNTEQKDDVKTEDDVEKLDNAEQKDKAKKENDVEKVDNAKQEDNKLSTLSNDSTDKEQPARESDRWVETRRKILSMEKKMEGDFQMMGNYHQTVDGLENVNDSEQDDTGSTSSNDSMEEEQQAKKRKEKVEARRRLLRAKKRNKKGIQELGKYISTHGGGETDYADTEEGPEKVEDAEQEDDTPSILSSNSMDEEQQAREMDEMVEPLAETIKQLEERKAKGQRGNQLRATEGRIGRLALAAARRPMHRQEKEGGKVDEDEYLAWAGIGMRDGG